MVLAATVRALQRGDLCCCCSKQYQFITINPFHEPTNKEQRIEVRRKEWNIWLSSTSDDIDLLSDWWFFIVTYRNRTNNADDGQQIVNFIDDDPLLLALFVFCCLGSITYILEFFHLTCVKQDQNNSWTWLQLLILIVEDIPQLILTLLISGSFSTLTPLGLFNIMTSLYSLMIRLAGELFLNWCFCCEKVKDDEDDDDDEDVEKANRYASSY